MTFPGCGTVQPTDFISSLCRKCGGTIWRKPDETTVPFVCNACNTLVLTPIPRSVVGELLSVSNTNGPVDE